jgi:hypothetical protein
MFVGGVGGWFGIGNGIGIGGVGGVIGIVGVVGLLLEMMREGELQVK